MGHPGDLLGSGIKTFNSAGLLLRSGLTTLAVLRADRLSCPYSSGWLSRSICRTAGQWRNDRPVQHPETLRPARWHRHAVVVRLHRPHRWIAFARSAKELSTYWSGQTWRRWSSWGHRCWDERRGMPDGWRAEGS